MQTKCAVRAQVSCARGVQKDGGEKRECSRRQIVEWNVTMRANVRAVCYENADYMQDPGARMSDDPIRYLKAPPIHCDDPIAAGSHGFTCRGMLE